MRSSPSFSQPQCVPKDGPEPLILACIALTSTQCSRTVLQGPWDEEGGLLLEKFLKLGDVSTVWGCFLCRVPGSSGR